MYKYLLYAAFAAIISICATNARAQSAPYFAGGDAATLSVCQNASATSINALLSVFDADAAETETWAAVASPMHGTLVAAYTTTSTGSLLTPSGLTYMPATGYNGPDTFSVEVSDGTFTDTIMIYVTVDPLPSAGTISTASAVCVGASATLSSSISGGSWSLTNTNASLSGTTLTGVTAGIDTIQYTVTDGCGTDVATRAITINPLPVAGTISGAASVCAGASITLTSSASGGTWSSSNATANVSSSGVVTGVSAGIDTITYFVVNSCGVAYTSTAITINPLPDAGTLTVAAGICVGATTIVSSSVSGGTWGITNSNATLSGDTVTGVTPGLDTVIYIFTNTCGSDTAWQTTSISPLPVAGTITGASAVCEGATITDTASVTGGTWSAVNPHATVSSAGIISGVSAGVDTIMYTVTNSCGSASATHIITVNPMPVTGSLSGATTVCRGASITLSASLAGGVWSASNATASLADSVVTGVTGGIDTISYSFTNACGTMAAVHIVTIDTIPAAGPITGRDRVCLGSTITLSAPVSGSWSSTNGTTSISGATVTGISFGRDTIINITSNACGADTAFHTVRVDTAAPVVSLITGPYIVCVNDTIRVADSVSGGTWRVTNSHASINSTGRIRGVSSGIDTVLYIATNGCGADTADYVITVNPLPNAGTITGYDSVCAGLSITLADAVPGGNWVSSNAAFADVDTAGRVTAYFAGSVTIYYLVSNSCGTDSAIKPININRPVQPILGSPTLCQGAFSLLVNPSPGGTWSTALASYLVIGPVIGGAVIGITVGTATVTYTLRNACGTTVATFDIEVVVCDSPTSVANISDNNATMSVSPNPSQGHFSISLPLSASDVAQVTITNVLGEEVKTFNLPTNKTTDVSLDVPAGVYLLSATAKGEKYTTRLIVTE